jgi:hypothetical protein
VKDDRLYSTPRKVTLKDDIYVNTGELDKEALEGTRSTYYDKSRQSRLAHLRVGSQLLIESLKHNRWWFLIDSYTVLECRPVDNPDLVFDYSVGVDGKLMPSTFAW